MSETPTVLYLCVHNAGRSQMAAGWTRHLGGDRVNVLSGGSAPAEHGSTPPPSRRWRRWASTSPATSRSRGPRRPSSAADVVVTMGCGDTCPVLPGKRYVDWELIDPAGKGIEDVRPIRDDIRGRVADLLEELGVEAEG
jgi:arsenate reductase (thioredoxin)